MKSRIIIAGIAAMAHPAIATTYQVNSLADHGPNTLRAAIATAVSGDTITFARWLYEKQIHLYSEITINKNLTIKGDLNDDHKPDITLDGQRKTRIFKIVSGSRLTLDSVELMRGHANEGGAIANWGTLYVKYSRFIRNESRGLGGAIYNKGFLNIETTTAMDNKAWSHGGVIYSNGTLRIQTSTFAHNLADRTGGVIYNDYTTAMIKNSTFSYNAVKRSGYWQNTDNKGSVLYNMMGTVEFRDSTLVDNVSSPITTREEKKRCTPSTCNNGDSETLKAVKRRNREKRMINGGTIYNYGGANAKEIILRRTVITGSQGRNCGGLGGFSAGASNWSDDWTCVQQLHYDDHGTDRGSPNLGPLADNGGYTLTHMPLAGSGLINGSPTTCAPKDQRGATRKEHCDIGSVEADHSAPSRALPTPINTTPPEEHNEDIAALNRRI
ncbi:choice-of-anchor Q domain-containing protein, partial [Thiolapillus sp.]|uniref:choice-of-anchor Q domain-containing protein n=3 Tax=Thiolapillus sp. TaxID=2017437 RepID=UPI003AF7508E